MKFSEIKHFHASSLTHISHDNYNAYTVLTQAR